MKSFNLYVPSDQVMNAGSLAYYVLLHIQAVLNVQLTYLERGNGGAVITVLSSDMPYVATQILQDGALYALKGENEKALHAVAISAPADLRGFRPGLPAPKSDHLS